MPFISESDAGQRVAAVVVSFNRRELLQRVLEGINSQTRQVDEIVVVDNGSTDGSREMLAEKFPAAVVIESKLNSGGAGGFAKGLSWSIQRSFDYAWLMDDDAIPDSTCLELLLKPFVGTGGDDISFSCPQVTDEQGKTGPRNYPVLSTDFPELYRLAGHSWLPVTAATFVGPLINLVVAKKTHAPLEDFFIWHDDFEYTTRLARLGGGVSVPAAHIMHLAANPGPDHYNAARNREHVRNLAWWWRELGTDDRSAQRHLGFRILMSLRHQYILAPNKSHYLRVVFNALKEAFSKHPRHRSYRDIYEETLTSDKILRDNQRLHHA
jgi:rhamnopyranosyl-N-acetylglucosaminyl-diphospho-decaprenol beta-1,3/1,4-galactofuranosyltransferase